MLPSGIGCDGRWRIDERCDTARNLLELCRNSLIYGSLLLKMWRAAAVGSGSIASIEWANRDRASNGSAQ